MANVYVGMSGGVDSSLTAALLVEAGHQVTGVYMKNWTQDLPGMRCPWADDLADAKRVAVQLGIDFKVFDFETDYREKVVEYMIAEYKAGRTPNPDIMCNQEVKFKLFLEAALEDGAAHLPVVEAVDEHQENPAPHTGCQGLLRIALAAGDPEPEHVDRRGGLDGLELRQLTHLREAAIRTHRQHGVDLVPAIPSPVTHAPHHPVFLEEFFHARPHDEQ